MVSRIPLALVPAAFVLAAACGGGDNSGDGGTTEGTAEVTDDRSAESGASDTTAAGSGAETEDDATDGSIDGALVSLLSPDLGLYAIDSATGEHRALSLDGVEYVDRENQPIAATTAAFTVSLTTLEGQSYAHDLGLVRIDLASGEASQIAELGVDRETDESEDLTQWEVLDADDSTVWLETRSFTGENTSFVGFDAESGVEVGRFDDLDFEVTTDAGSTCSGAADGLLVMPGSELITMTSGWPAVLDPATGGIEMTFEWCGFGVEPTLADFVDPWDADQWFVTADGSTVDADAAEQVLSFMPLNAVRSHGRGVAEGDGSLWWIFVQGTSIPTADESVSAYAGGVVRFDPAAGEVTEIWSLGDAAATYLHDDDDDDDDDGEDDGTATVSTLSSFDLRYIDDALWIVDHRDDAPIRRLDPATGEITEITIEKGEGIDLTQAEMIFSDPEAIWLDVVRKVITSDDESGRSTSGTQFIERADTSRGTITVSVSGRDILGF